ncbi:MAG: chemotaxis protein CheW [Treponema sp.]|nr:chemotaxis protein CheW [Treponema sp.]
MAALIKDLAQMNADLQEQKERVENVDFKMITFSLAGKDYGVDIMNVKEIAKADKFTFVPNAASFVRGVYNLRGDIIPIIDLRNFFHLSVDKKTDGQENMLILRIDDGVYGTIVDKIDKVVGINSETIQPPHPIFGDINIKYIKGVVEKNGDLYIILDVIRIFSHKEEDKVKSHTVIETADAFIPTTQKVDLTKRAAADSAMEFIKETLGTLRHFTVSEISGSWFARRFAEWNASHDDENLQLRSSSDADEFLSAFYSPCTGNFWSADYAALTEKALPDISSNTINVWNIGCGKGFETFSFACILKKKYPGAHIKIWANDNDIMAISQATNIVFDYEDYPEYIQPFIVKGRNGYSFNQEIRDTIVFEYHDVVNGNSLPDLDIILCRDVISFFSQSDQEKLVTEFEEKLKTRGMVILGRNEELPGTMWQSAASDPVSVFCNI